MFICSIAVLFLVLQNSCGLWIYPSDVPKCSEVGYVARRTFLEEHNKRRTLLAKGDVDIKGGVKLSPAANMRFMAYDCKLEQKAIELVKTCKRITSETQFSGTRANFAVIDSRTNNGEISAPREAVSQWWNKSSEWHAPQNITEKDKSAIPFFLMAQAEGDKVGCSVRKCRKAGSNASYYSVACVYEKKVQVGSELYIQGPPCLNCPDDYTLHKDGLCKKPN